MDHITKSIETAVEEIKEMPEDDRRKQVLGLWSGASGQGLGEESRKQARSLICRISWLLARM